MQIFIDIEWAVDRRPPTQYMESLAASLKKPNLKDPEKLKAAAEARVYSPAKAGIYSRIICVVLGWNTESGPKLITLGDHSDGPATEVSILEQFNRVMEEDLRCKIDQPDFTGFNVRGDLRVLAQRFMAYGLKPACFLPYQFQPWSDRYTDLMWRFDPEVYPKLSELCYMFDIEADDEITGADVQGLWDSGDIETIVKHCVADVQRTMTLADCMGM